MPILHMESLRAALPRVQWRHGLRAGLAVGVAMAACSLLHRPMGWAALGALYVSLVDSGGPARTRMDSMAMVLLPGSLAVLVGSVSAGVAVPAPVLGLAITFVVCFGATLARAVAQPIAATSVLVLICYVVSYGDGAHGVRASALNAANYLAGGLWSASLAFVLWPLDPFLPARRSVAALYATLQELAAALAGFERPRDDAARKSDAAPVDGIARFNLLVAQTRAGIEAAHTAIAATPARMTARTVRARNLKVLVESADLLLARILSVGELAFGAAAARHAVAAWLRDSLAPIEAALVDRPVDRRVDRRVDRPVDLPVDGGLGFAPEGSRSLHLQRTRPRVIAAFDADPALAAAARPFLAAGLDDIVFQLELSYEAVRALWTGSESRASGLPPGGPTSAAHRVGSLSWTELLRANLTLRSVMFRFALRLAAVVTLDQLLLRLVHVGHSYWLPMTSLIVLRPYAGETVKRSADRVLGTVLGGVLAALLTAVLPSDTALLGVVVLCSAACVAVYAVDYAWYCLFVTPAIVLLTRPHLHDWHLAALRAGFTVVGAGIAVLAMLLLWPERESLQLPGLLAQGAAADAAYLRALVEFWRSAHEQPRVGRMEAERTLLAPARRLCGLAVNNAEETLDHAVLEYAIPLNPRRSHTQRLNSAALTFTTYLRRTTRTTTTLAAIGYDAAAVAASGGVAERIRALADRLDAVAGGLRQQQSARATPAANGAAEDGSGTAPPQPTQNDLAASDGGVAADQLRRLERQVLVLERTAAEIGSAGDEELA